MPENSWFQAAKLGTARADSETEFKEKVMKIKQGGGRIIYFIPGFCWI